MLLAALYTLHPMGYDVQHEVDMKLTWQSYREGIWFTAPLQSGGFVRGVVARLDGETGILGYFSVPACWFCRHPVIKWICIHATPAPS